MISADKECDAIATLFSKKSVRSRFPVYVKSENPMFKRKGSSFNLKNLREYQPFDDLRQIDWKLYGRTDRFFIKEFFEEENDRFFFLIDSSASLKIFDLDYYRTFILSLAYILLKLHFTVSLVSFHQRVVKTSLNIKEPRNISRVVKFLEDLSFEKPTDLNGVLKRVRERFQPSTLFLFTDFFDRGYSPESSVHFRRSFLFHFYTSLDAFDLDYGETEVLDEERQSRLLMPYTLGTARDMRRREARFLDRFAAIRDQAHYMRLAKNEARVPYYWRLLESLYD